MDYMGQTAVLSAILVLVGMVFLVPATTGKALATVRGSATATCGPEKVECPLVWQADHLVSGWWVNKPSISGLEVTWRTGSNTALNEEGSVTYKVGEDTAILNFDNPAVGSNKCSIGGSILSAGTASNDCKAGKGMDAQFTYTLHNSKFTPPHHPTGEVL